MSEKITALASAKQNGDVSLLFHSADGSMGFNMSAKDARWLSMELISAADRAEGYVAINKLHNGEELKACTK